MRPPSAASTPTAGRPARSAAPVLRVPRQHCIGRGAGQSVQAIVAGHGGMGFEWSATPEERSRLWKARHDAYFACVALRPGYGFLHRRVRADLDSRALHRPDRGRGQGGALSHHAGRARGRRQFSPGMNIDPNDAAKWSWPSRSTGAWSSAPSPWAAPAPASTASAWGSWISWSRSTVRTSRSCARSSARSTRATCSIREAAAAVGLRTTRPLRGHPPR